MDRLHDMRGEEDYLFKRNEFAQLWEIFHEFSCH